MYDLRMCGRKPTAGRIFTSALALVATGFLVACGYDIYSRLFRK